MIEYINQFTLNDFIVIYCVGMLSIILMIASLSIVMLVVLHAIDALHGLLLKNWYETKKRKRYYEKQMIKEGSR